MRPCIADFATSLVNLGVRKLYPDTIAHALYLALKHDITLDLKDDELIGILVLDDCISNVLLLEYAKRHRRSKVKSAVNKRAKDLLPEHTREKDKHWLLIYQVWSKKELEGNGQGFLASIKSKGFEFLCIPLNAQATAVKVGIQKAKGQPEEVKA